MNLHQFLLILLARWHIAVLTLFSVVAATVAINLILPKEYTASASLVIDAKATDPVTGATVPALMMPGYLPTQVDIIKSDRVAMKVVKMLKMDESAESRSRWQEVTDGRGNLQQWLGASLQKSVDVQPARESSLIEITYTSVEPKFAAILANTFAQAYIDTNLEMRVDPARQTSAWFDERAKVLKENLEKAQLKLSAYQQEHGIVAVDERLDVENSRLAELSSQLTSIQAQSVDSQSRQKQAHGSGMDSSPDVLQNPMVLQLRTDLSRSESRLQDIAAVLGSNHPQYQRMLAEKQSLQQKLDSEMKRVATSLGSTSKVNVQRESEIRSSLAAQKKRVLALKSQHDEISMLMREVDTAQKAYDLASQRQTMTNLESQITQSSIFLLSPAVEPLDASKPKVFRNALIATFLGTLLGIGMAFLTELTRPKVRSTANLTDLLGSPVLGTVGAGQRRRFSGLFQRFRPA